VSEQNLTDERRQLVIDKIRHAVVYAEALARVLRELLDVIEERPEACEAEVVATSRRRI
jgi:hypothetical protein